MSTPSATPEQTARLARLAKARAAAGWVENDVEVNWALRGSIPCGRYLYRNYTEDGDCRLELVETLWQMEQRIANDARSTPAWWPAWEALDLDTGVEVPVPEVAPGW